MKKRFASLCALLLAFALILPAAVPVTAEDAHEINVRGYSYLTSDVCIKLLQSGNRLYISGEEAARHSGFTVSEEDDCTFERGLKLVIISDFITVDGVKYFPFESTMEKLYTDVKLLDNGLLSIRGKETSFFDIMAMNRDVIFNSGNFDVVEPGEAGKAAKFGAFIYDVAGSFGSIGNYITGKEDTDVYKDILIALLDAKQSRVVKSISALDKTRSKLKNFADAFEAFENRYGEKPSDTIKDDMAEILAEMVLEESYNHNAGTVETLASLLHLADEVEDLDKKIDEVNGQFDIASYKLSGFLADKFGDKDFKLKGITPMGYLKILSYYDTLAGASTVYDKMISYTFPGDSDETQKIKWPTGFKKVITDYYEANDSSPVEAAKFITRQLMSDFAAKNAGAVIDVFVEKMLENQIGAGLPLAQEGAKVLSDLCTEAIYGTSSESIIEFGKQTLKLYDLQRAIVSQDYRYCASPKKYALNLKYSAMLYIRCYLLYMEAYQKAMPKEDVAGLIQSAKAQLNRLNEVSDFDLTYEPSNELIDPDQITEWDVSENEPYKTEKKYRFFTVVPKKSVYTDKYDKSLANQNAFYYEWTTEYYFWGIKETFSGYYTDCDEPEGSEITYFDLSGRTTKLENMFYDGTGLNIRSTVLYEYLDDPVNGYSMHTETTTDANGNVFSRCVVTESATAIRSETTYTSGNINLVVTTKDEAGRPVEEKTYNNGKLYEYKQWYGDGTYYKYTLYNEKGKVTYKGDSKNFTDNYFYFATGY